MPNPSLLDWQIPFIFDRTPGLYKGIAGGRVSIKTTSFLIASTVWPENDWGSVYATREFSTQTKESLREHFEEVFERYQRTGWKLTNKELTYRPNGRKISLTGVERRSGRGQHGYKVFWIDEAQDVTDGAMTDLEPTFVRMPGYQLWASFNPKSPDDWASKEFLLDDKPKHMIKRVNWADVRPHWTNLTGNTTEQIDELVAKHKKEWSESKFNWVWLGKYYEGADEPLFNVGTLSTTATTLQFAELAQEPHEVYSGLDLATSVDTNAASFAWTPDGINIHIKTKLFVPPKVWQSQGNKQDRERWESWAAAGYCVLCDPDVQGKHIDLDLIADFYQNEVAGKLNLMSVLMDRHEGQGVEKRLTNMLIDVEYCPQGFAYSPLVTLFNKLTEAGRIIIDENPCVLWMWGNAVGEMNKKGQEYPRKFGERAALKIDAVDSSLMALKGLVQSGNLFDVDLDEAA